MNNKFFTLANVNLKSKTFVIKAESAKYRREVTLPLYNYLVQVLQRRKAAPYAHPRKVFGLKLFHENAMRVRQLSGIDDFTPLGLQRAFVSTGNSLNLSPYSVKALVNHAGDGDITARYDQVALKPLREATQKITDYILKAAGEGSGTVVSLQERRRGR